MNADRIRRAAELLRGEAQCLQESFGRPPDFHWPSDADADDGDRRARADCEEMRALADYLDQLAGPDLSDECAHEWAYTGTEYGGDDDSYHGEGRAYCTKCGADGDG